MQNSYDHRKANNYTSFVLYWPNNSTFRGWIIIIEAGFHNNNCADFDSVDSSDHSTGNLLERAARDWSDLSGVHLELSVPL